MGRREEGRFAEERQEEEKEAGTSREISDFVMHEGDVKSQRDDRFLHIGQRRMPHELVESQVGMHESTLVVLP